MVLVLSGAYPVRRIMGRGLERNLTHWEISLAAATPFAGVWTWTSFVIAEAIRVGTHPEAAGEAAQLTWGLPWLLSVPFFAFGGLLLQVVVAVMITSVIIVVVGHTWAG